MVFLLQGYADHRDLHSFPTRRSSDLIEKCYKLNQYGLYITDNYRETEMMMDLVFTEKSKQFQNTLNRTYDKIEAFRGKDRKSTRLNSSHVRISYAVFCLKKKNKIINR